jgi:hypothetical protein
VAIRHFDSTAGDVAGDADLGVGGFGDRLPDLRLPVRRVIRISSFPATVIGCRISNSDDYDLRGHTAVRLCLFEWLFTNLVAGLPTVLESPERASDGPGAECRKTDDEGVGGETIISA